MKALTSEVYSISVSFDARVKHGLEEGEATRRQVDGDAAKVGPSAWRCAVYGIGVIAGGALAGGIFGGPSTADPWTNCVRPRKHGAERGSGIFMPSPLDTDTALLTGRHHELRRSRSSADHLHSNFSCFTLFKAKWLRFPRLPSNWNFQESRGSAVVRGQSDLNALEWYRITG